MIFWVGLGHATLYALYDYFGYYNVCYLAEEIRDPGRVIPRAIMFSIVCVAVLYVMMTASFLSVIPWREATHSPYIASVYVQILFGSTAGKVMTRAAALDCLLLGFLVAPRLLAHPLRRRRRRQFLSLSSRACTPRVISRTFRSLLWG